MSSPKLIGSLFAAILMLAAAGAAPAGEGKLESVKEEVRDRDKDDADEGHHGARGGGDGDRHSHHGPRANDHDDNGFVAEVFVEPAMEFTVWAALWLLATPFWAPMELTGDFSARRPYVFEDYPYADGAWGHPRPARLVKRPAEEQREDQPPTRWESIEGRADSSSALFSFERHSDGIQGFRTEYQLRTFSRLNLDLSATDYAEEVGGDVEHMGHFKGHVTYSFAVSRHAVFSAGVGARLLSWEDGESRGGLDFRYEVEFFPVRPLHLQAIAEAGWVGDEGAWELEARVGVLFRRLEAFVGYRHFHVAGQDLAGPTVGLMLWF